MADFEIDSREVIALGARYKDGPRIVQQELLSAMGGAVTLTQANVREVIAPFSWTGRLSRETVTAIRQSAKQIVGRVYNTAPYAFWVDQGRGAVRPVRKQWLHYVTRIGQVVFSKYSAPFAGHHFMHFGLQRSRQDIVRRFERAAERIATRLLGGR